MEDKLKHLKESMDESIFKENPVSHINKERIFKRIEKNEMKFNFKQSLTKWSGRGALAIVGFVLVLILWDTVGKEIINSPNDQQQSKTVVEQEENEFNKEQDDESVHKTLHFRGKSDNWQVQYIAAINIKRKDNEVAIGSETNYLELQYIGDGQPPIQIDYKISDKINKNSGTDVTLNSGVLDTDLGGCDQCVLTTENDEKDIAIEWDGKREEIKLTITLQ